MDVYLKDLDVHDLDHPYLLSYQCRCSKERLGNALALLGHMEVEKMIEENQPAEARCEFCGRHYVIEIEELTGPAGKTAVGHQSTKSTKKRKEEDSYPPWRGEFSAG